MARRRRVRRVARALIWSGVALAAALAFVVLTRTRPQDVPWTPLDLAQPVGLFTGRKIAMLGDDPAQCRALLMRAGARHDVVPPFGANQCRVGDAVRLGGGARSIALRPDSPAMACPVAAGLAVWEWEVVQPAARLFLGQRVVAIEHYGSWSCRRIYGRAEGGWSEHATADAIDVAGFRLADGTRISVLNEWKREGDKAAFLRAVRDGACDLFSTVLSPDYNAAHADHLHLDQAARGAVGWRGCR